MIIQVFTYLSHWMPLQFIIIIAGLMALMVVFIIARLVKIALDTIPFL